MLGLERINNTYKLYEQGRITKAQFDELLKKLLPVRISDIQREIKKENFRKYLNLEYIKKEMENEKLRYDYENSPCGTNNHIGEQDEI